MKITREYDAPLYHALLNAREHSLSTIAYTLNYLWQIDEHNATKSGNDSRLQKINDLRRLLNEHIKNHSSNNKDLHQFIAQLNSYKQDKDFENNEALNDCINTLNDEASLTLYRAIFHVHPLRESLDKIDKNRLALFYVTAIVVGVATSQPLLLGLILLTPCVILGLTMLLDLISFYPLVHSMPNYIETDTPVVKKDLLDSIARISSMQQPHPTQRVTGTPYSYFDKIKVEKLEQPPEIRQTCSGSSWYRGG